MAKENEMVCRIRTDADPSHEDGSKAHTHHTLQRLHKLLQAHKAQPQKQHHDSPCRKKEKRFRRQWRSSTLVLVACVLVLCWTAYCQHALHQGHSSRIATTLRQNKDTTVGPAVPRDSVAACLLLFDDNLSLVEWLAYHYHTLQLRHVIVLTDPRSTQSPVSILERWSASNTDQTNSDSLLTWELWDETRVFPSTQELQQLKAKNDLVQLHRKRQGYFYGQCLRELKQRSQVNTANQQHSLQIPPKDEWVLLTDVDEYVAINPRIEQPHHKLYRPNQDSLLAKPGSVLDFLRNEQDQPPCYHMARRDMVSLESSPLEINVGVPPFLNASHFYTTRWRHQSDRRITGKCLVNLAPLAYTDLPIRAPRQGHVPLTQCPTYGPKYYINMENSPLIIHHYLGTQAQYQYRDDPRRDRTGDGFVQKQNQPTTVRDNLRSWLGGFVKQVGPQRAQQLLAGAGSLQVR